MRSQKVCWQLAPEDDDPRLKMIVETNECDLRLWEELVVVFPHVAFILK